MLLLLIMRKKIEIRTLNLSSNLATEYITLTFVIINAVPRQIKKHTLSLKMIFRNVSIQSH